MVILMGGASGYDVSRTRYTAAWPSLATGKVPVPKALLNRNHVEFSLHAASDNNANAISSFFIQGPPPVKSTGGGRGSSGQHGPMPRPAAAGRAAGPAATARSPGSRARTRRQSAAAPS